MPLAEDINEELRIKSKAVESSLNGIIFTDITGRVLYSNPAFIKMWGYKNSSEVVGKLATDFVEKKKIIPMIRKILLDKGEWTDEFEGRKKDGSKLFVILSASVVKEGGKAPVIMASMTDVSRLKETEKRLRRSEELYRTLLENYPDFLIGINRRGNMVLVNDYLLHSIGYKREEVIGKSFRSFVPVKYYAVILKNMALGFSEKERKPFEIEVKTKKGKLIPVEISRAGFSLHEDGDIKVRVVSGRDITERKIAEGAVKASEEKFRTLFDNYPDLLIGVDKTGKIIAINDMAERLGYKKEDIIGSGFRNYVPMKYIPKIVKAIAGEFVGISTPPFEIEIKNRKGELIPYEISAGTAPIHENGKLVGIVASARDIGWRKEAERALKESEEKFRDLFENANDLIQSVDADGKFNYVNKRWKEALGYSDEEVKKLNLMDVIHKDYHAQCKKIFKEVCRGKSFGNIEAVFVTKKGKNIFLIGSANAFMKNGKFIATSGIFKDITLRKEAEQKLKEALEKLTVSEEELRTTNEDLISVNARLNERVKEMNCLYECARLTERTDMSMEKMLEKAVKLLPPAFQYPDDACARITVNGNEFKTKNFRQTKWKLSASIRIDGKKTGAIEVYYLEEKPKEYKGPFSLEEEDLIHAVARHFGASIGNKEDEKALRASEERFRQLFEQPNDAIFLIGLDGKVVDANKKAEQMLGFKKKEIIGQKIIGAQPEENREIYEKGFSELKKKGKIAFESVLNTKKGKTVPVDINAKIIDIRGEKFILAIVRDLSEKQMLLMEIEERKAKEIKAGLLGMVSHELKTPLTPLKTQVNLMLDGSLGKVSEEQKLALGIVLKNSERLERLINDLLEISKIKAREMSLKYEETDLNVLVKDSVKYIESTAKKNGIRIITDYGNLPKVECDARRIQQVMRHLLDNALAFTPEKGTVTVKTEKEGGFIRVSVKDSGIGISKKDMEKVFEPFFQADSTITRKHGGPGLGLAVSKGIIEIHGGDMRAESRGPGKGSIFIFTLPIKAKKKVNRWLRKS